MREESPEPFKKLDDLKEIGLSEKQMQPSGSSSSTSPVGPTISRPTVTSGVTISGMALVASAEADTSPRRQFLSPTIATWNQQFGNNDTLEEEVTEMTLENNENQESGGSKKNFRWSDKSTIVLCDVLIEYIIKNGCGQFYKWRDIERDTGFRIGLGRPCPIDSCKHKTDAMRKEWRSWRALRIKETGLGWDPKSGKIDAPPEWWEKNKGEAFIKKFREKGITSLLEEKWEQIFGDTYATGSNVYVPAMEPPIVILGEDEGTMEERIPMRDMFGEEENVDVNHLHEHDYDLDEENFVRDFVDCVSGGIVGRTQGNIGASQVASQTEIRNEGETTTRKTTKQVQRPEVKANSMQMKRKRRQSGGSAMLGDQIKDMVETCKMMSQAVSTNTSKQQSSTSTIGKAMQIIKRMVNNCILEKGSDFWCFTTHLLEDDVKREIFLSMDDDDSREKWLKYQQRMKDN